MAKAKNTDKYPFVASFALKVAYFECSRPEFHARIGHALDYDCMPTEEGKLAVQAAHAIAKDSGKGPGDLGLVLQRLKRWSFEGKVTVDQICAVSDSFDEAEDGGGLDAEATISELTPILKRRAHHAAVVMATKDYTDRGDMNKVVSILNKASTLGVAANSPGIIARAQAFDSIDALCRIQKLPTGIDDLDYDLQGGLGRGSLGMFIGGPGDGKSMTLSQLTAFSMLSGLNCCYASTELPDGIIFARLIAAVTERKIDDIMANRGDGRELYANMKLGVCRIRYFTPQVTSVRDITEWVQVSEAEEGRPVDLLVVDYADKLIDPSIESGHAYKMMELVYEKLRIFAEERRGWCWTASQSTLKSGDSKGRRGKGKKGKQDDRSLDLENVADSSNKVRVADLVVTLNASEDQSEMTFFIAKNRVGKSRKKVGPLPTDLERGLVAPMAPVDRQMKNAGENILADQVEMAFAGGEPF